MSAFARSDDRFTRSTTAANRTDARLAAPMPPAWEDLMLAYERAREADGISARSIANRRSAMRWLARWLEAEFGIADPDAVKPDHMKQAMAVVHRTRARSGSRTAFNDWKSIWDFYAADTGNPSPLQGIRRPRDVITPVPLLTALEVEKILRATSGRDFHSVRNSAIIDVLLETGMRRFELTALDISDVDVRAREAVIRSAKGGRARVVVFGPATASALFRWLRMHPLRAERNGPLFTTTNGRRLSDCSVGEALHRVGDKAGVPGLRPHQMRHTWTHVGLASGMQEHDMQQLGGWTSTTQLGRCGAALAAQRAKAAGKSKPVLKLIRAG